MSSTWSIRDNCGWSRLKKVDISHNGRQPSIIRFPRNMGIMLIRLWKLIVIKRYPRGGILIFCSTNDLQTLKRISFDRMKNTSKFLMISISALEWKKIHHNSSQITMYFLHSISQMRITKICKLIRQMRISKSSNFLIKILNIFLSWLCNRFPTPWERKQLALIRMWRTQTSNTLQEYWIPRKRVNNNKIIHSEKKTKNHQKMYYNRKRSAN